MSLWSKMFGGGQVGKEDLSGGATKVVWQFIADEDMQNELLPPELKEKIKGGSAVDEVPNGEGAFGLDQRNPIPVNGFFGEVAYLSRLESLKGEQLLFHRLGSASLIDVYEAVTMSGSSWHLFFMDLYHPRRSRRAPEGFRVGEPKQFTGFNRFCPGFPFDFVEAKEEAGALGPAYAPLSRVTKALEQNQFTRPLAHKAKLSIVQGMLTSGDGAVAKPFSLDKVDLSEKPQSTDPGVAQSAGLPSSQWRRLNVRVEMIAAEHGEGLSTGALSVEPSCERFLEMNADGGASIFALQDGEGARIAVKSSMWREMQTALRVLADDEEKYRAAFYSMARRTFSEDIRPTIDMKNGLFSEQGGEPCINRRQQD